VTTIQALVLDARWEAIELLLLHRYAVIGVDRASTIAPRWPASATRRHRVLLDELGRSGRLDWSG
jgi:hypothetical protein